ARGAILGGLCGVRMDSVEIVTSDKQIAGETAAVFERIARGLRKLERLTLAFRHFRRVDDGGWQGRFRLCAGFLSDLFFRCFERRFHITHLSFQAQSRLQHSPEYFRGEARLSISRYPLKIRDVSTSLDMTGMAFEQLSILIKFRPIPRMFFQNLARSKFCFSSGQPFQCLDDFLQTKVFSESQRPAAKGRETGPQNHSVIRILWRIDDSF